VGSRKLPQKTVGLMIESFIWGVLLIFIAGSRYPMRALWFWESNFLSIN